MHCATVEQVLGEQAPGAGNQYQAIRMESSIFRYILKYTLKDQIVILLFTAISLPLIYASLEVPKMIINDAIGGANIPDSLFGYPLDQISYLIILCFAFLGLVLINGGLKYVLNVYRGVVGERMLRRLRYDLFTRILRFPRAHMKKVSAGETVPIITAETEPLGGFIGEAFALPAFQGGILFTYLFFIFNQDLLLGVVATALYPFQLYIIPKLQRKVNALGKQRVMAARQLGDKIGDTISGIDEVHANDTSRYERAVISGRLGKIYEIRLQIYKKKFFIKFINNFLAQVTPFFFYLFGGYYIITGALSLGALVAVLAAYKDLSSPWKELLKYYQTKEDVRIKYEQIIEQFHPPDMLDDALESPGDRTLDASSEGWAANSLGYEEEEGMQILERLSFNVDLTAHTAIVGLGDSGKEELGHLLAGLVYPTQGRMTLTGMEMQRLPRPLLGRYLSHVGANAHLFSGSIRDNLLYGLRHELISQSNEDVSEQDNRIRAAELSGNSTDDPEGSWIALSVGDNNNDDPLRACLFDVLEASNLTTDIFQMGLFGKLKAKNSPLQEKVLEARRSISTRLKKKDYSELIELFDRSAYNRNITVLENLLFSPVGDSRQERDTLAGNANFQELLEQQGLLQDFVSIGQEITGIMVDVFSNVDADSDLFERFSFIQADRLPEYQALLAKTRELPLVMKDKMAVERYLALTFQLAPGRHRLGLIDDELQARIVSARHSLIKDTPDLGFSLNFFNSKEFHPDLNLLDNMLYGKLVYGQARAEEKINALINEVVEELNLQQGIVEVGLGYDVGTAGKRLSLAQRQKLAIARGLLKDPVVMILNEATSGLDPTAERQVLNNIQERLQGRGLIFVTSRGSMTQGFEHLFVLEKGKLVEQGGYEELENKGGRFAELLN